MNIQEERAPNKEEPSQENKRPVEPRAPEPVFYVPLNIVFYLCCVSHILAALYAPIQDCDETFNYWEPLHYLNHGYGLQTWEYSPEFAIRSWAYIVIHAIPAKLAGLLTGSKSAEFYSLRIALAIASAATETKFYSAISRNLNPRIGVFYVIMLITCPGMFYASVALLPSSFAMYTATLGLTSFIDWRSGPRSAQGIMWFGIGALLGWPFAGVLVVPFVFEEWSITLISGGTRETLKRYLDGATRCLVVLALQMTLDAFFYRKVVVVPWRIVFYNVLSGGDRGPNIFGTEPWHFYVRNLLLNFNLWFPLAILAAPLLVLHNTLRNHVNTKATLIRLWVLITPFYLWLGIFTAQPHKEERFMYPAYPFLILNASIALHTILTMVGSSDPKTLMGRIPSRLKLASIGVVILFAVNAGFLRTFGTVSAYRAPLQIYDRLNAVTVKANDTVCFGKDWYRFPTSHFLPNGMHAKFVKSDFDGLLPGEFSEANFGLGRYPGTWLMPSGMNDQNEEDADKHTDVARCSYLVDTHMPGSTSSALEPIYVLDAAWETVTCVPFLDTARTGLLARTIWIPNSPVIPRMYQRYWGEHCLLKRRRPLTTTAPAERLQR